jgi:RNA recognition motif-containing protein
MGVEIYVGQISGTVTEDEVRKLFSVVGTVESVHLVIDPGSGESRGCGYVRMSTDDEAREAIDLLNGAKLGDRLIVVKNAPPKIFKGSGSTGGGGGQGRNRGTAGSSRKPGAAANSPRKVR